MKLDIKRLTVKYNERIVGYLELLANEKIAFQYDIDWIKNGFSISPFSLPLSYKVFQSTSEYFGGLHGVFFDSLPDGWGELITRRELAKNGINYDRLNPLTKLSLVPKNGLGGLDYEPTQKFDSVSNDINLDKIALQIKKVLESESSNINLDQLYKLGGASGGARPKIHLNIEGEQWIVKFAASIDPKDIGLKEYNTNLAAEQSNILVNTFNLFPSNKCKGYFGAKRFDREGDKKIHVISLAAMLETTHRIPNLDYAHLFQVIQKICINQNEMYEAYKRMCFNVICGNRDDHSKNMAFLYDESIKSYRLTPFYDITQTPDKIEHEMTVLGIGKPTVEDLLEIAKKYNLSLTKCQNIIKKIQIFALE